MAGRKRARPDGRTSNRYRWTALLLRLLGAAMACWAQPWEGWDTNGDADEALRNLHIEALSLEWEVQPDFATVRAIVKILLVKRDENQSTVSCARFNSAQDCTVVWLSDNTNCNVLGLCDERQPWQHVDRQSISVSGAAHAMTLEAEGGPLHSYATTKEDRFRLHIGLGRTGSFRSHSVHIKYDIANALCVAEELGWGERRLPPGLASRGGAEELPNAHRFQFDASWANWLETRVVRDISYALVLPAPASLWSDYSPALLSPSQDTNASSSHLPHVTEQGRRVLRKRFTPKELGIDEYAATLNFSAAAKLIFTFATSPSSGIPVIVNHTRTPHYRKAHDALTHRSCSCQRPPFNSLEHDSPLLMVLFALVLAGGSCLCCCCCERSPASHASDVSQDSSVRGFRLMAHLVIRYSTVFAFDLYAHRVRRTCALNFSSVCIYVRACVRA